MLTKMNRKDNNNVAVTARYLAGKGYTLTRAALNVGVSPSHLTLVLRGERKPSAALLERLRALPKLKPVCCRVEY